MTTAELVEKIKTLPVDKQGQVERYIRFLLSEAKKKESSGDRKKEMQDNK